MNILVSKKCVGRYLLRLFIYLWNTSWFLDQGTGLNFYYQELKKLQFIYIIFTIQKDEVRKMVKTLKQYPSCNIKNLYFL